MRYGFAKGALVEIFGEEVFLQPDTAVTDEALRAFDLRSGEVSV
jgi:hypothetical protein